MASSKAKGNKGERDLCKWFQQWTGFPFTRVPASGGLRWKNTNATSGDIICDDERHSRRFLLSVESKLYKDINFEHIILDTKKSKTKIFWEQTKADALRSNKFPILFMRYAMMAKNTYFVALPISMYYLFTQEEIESFEFPRFMVMGKEPMCIMNSNDLLKVNYMNLHKSLKRVKNGQEN